MPISIRLLMFGPPDFAISLKVRFQRRVPAKAGEDERERLRRRLSRRLSPQLLRDVLPD